MEKIHTTIFLLDEGGFVSEQLLRDIRRINKQLHNMSGYRVPLMELATTLGEILQAGVVITNQDGLIGGIFCPSDIPVIDFLYGLSYGDRVDSKVNEQFLSVFSTKQNVDVLATYYSDYSYKAESYETFVVPVDISGSRLGTVFCYRLHKSFETDDIILGEYISTVVSIENLNKTYLEARTNQELELAAKNAVRALSGLELKAAEAVLKEALKTKEAIIISHIADNYGISRTIIVNAIKKMAGAGVLRASSMGVKGTYVRVENPYLDRMIQTALFKGY